MIPIKNKKKTLEVTIDEMTNFALNYVEKFAPSKQQLRTYLLKKYLTSRTPNIKKNDVSNLIDIVLEDLEKSKFILIQAEMNMKNISQNYDHLDQKIHEQTSLIGLKKSLITG